MHVINPGRWPTAEAVITVAAATVTGNPVGVDAHGVLGMIADLAAVMHDRIIGAIHAEAPGWVPCAADPDGGDRADADAGEAVLVGRIAELAGDAGGDRAIGTLAAELVYWTLAAQPATAVQLGAAAANYQQRTMQCWDPRW